MLSDADDQLLVQRSDSHRLQNSRPSATLLVMTWKQLLLELVAFGSLIGTIVLIQWKPLVLGTVLVVTGAFAPFGRQMNSESPSGGGAQDAVEGTEAEGSKKKRSTASPKKAPKAAARRGPDETAFQGSFVAGALKAAWKGPIRGGVILAGIVIIVLSFASGLVTGSS